MAELVNMPKLGFDMQEGQLVNWLKGPGDQVEKGDVVAEIESDKATVEVEVYQSGTLLDLLVEAGSWVPVGNPIAVIGDEGEDYDPSALGLGDGSAEAEEETAAAEATTTEKEPERQMAAAGGNGHGFPEGVRASPLARRMAEEMDIDIGRIGEGSGPKGRIVRADVEAYAEAPPAERDETPSERAEAPSREAGVMVGRTRVNVGPDDEVIETSRLRTRIAERMSESKQVAPHFYVTTDIDMGPAMDLRKELNQRFKEKGIKISVNDMIVKAVALALRDYPNLNAAYNGDEIVRYGHINIGIAVAVENGLMNVVSKDADQKSLAQMAPQHKEMIQRARDGKVKPEDLEGETFAVSNLGAWDVDHFIAILNPPNAGIVAVGSATKQPVINDEGEIVVGTRMKATVSADHRVTDGAEAAEFMQRIKEILEDPFMLLM